MDYGEGFAMTGFYVALNEDNGAGMAGFSPEAVLRTLSGLRIRSPGKRSATGGGIHHAAKNPAPFGTGFFLNAKTKSPVFRPGFLLYLMRQFMAGVLPATLRAVAAQRSNPLPADLSSSGERSPTDNRQNKRPSLSTEPFVLFDAAVPYSHGETPHYHRRYGVSLLSSAWGQVGPPR